MRNISIFGVTGSIGKSSLNVIDNFKDQINLISVSTHKNIKELFNIIDKYQPQYAVITDEQSYNNYFYNTNKYKDTIIHYGLEGIIKAGSDKQNDIIINAIAGKAGLIPSEIVLKSGINLALANKESIVCAGMHLINISKQTGAQIIPVDSEHSAIFSLLKSRKKESIEKIYLTASGGPFRNLDKSEFKNITVKDALKHPTWSMGQKISIDSATMANKGLEIIEAHYLFDINYDDIKVLIHPQSLIHSMVETIDKEIYAQIGPKDMSLPIQNAIFYPEVIENKYNKLDFTSGITLELLPPEKNKFKMLDFAYYCGKKQGALPAFYNYFNEYLVDLFLNEKISFLDIENHMESGIKKFELSYSSENYINNISDLTRIDKIAETIIKEIV